MGILLAISLLTAPGDIMLLTVTSPVPLTGPQQTTLATGITAQWPGIVLAEVIGFHAERRSDNIPLCAVRRSETIDAPTLFNLLVSGTIVEQGLTATARNRWFDPDLCVSGLTTAMASLASALAPGATAQRIRVFDCIRQSGGVVCTVGWAKSFSQAAAFTEFQNGTKLVPLGVE